MITLLLIVITGILSYRGFRNPMIVEANAFQVERVRVHREWKRLVSSGFVHVNWLHLIFNLITLYFFSGVLENYLGPFRFLLIYFGGLVGGNLLALYIQRHNPSYSAVGASGAINGVIFATIALFPGMGIGLFFLPLSIPSWLFGLLFVGFSMWGIQSQRGGGIGHEAHLGGALAGMALALLLVPQALGANLLPILVLTVPTLVFLALLVYRPQALRVGGRSAMRQHYYSVDHSWNYDQAERQRELDRILEKISQKGMESLTREEKQKLDRYSRTMK